MAQIDSLLGIIVFFIISSIIITIIFSLFFISQTTDYETRLYQTNQKINKDKLDLILTIDDIYSKDTISNIIVPLLIKNEYETIYGNINLNKSFKKNLDFFFGENNYYIKIVPRINNIRLNILYDDGEYMNRLSNLNNFSKSINKIYENFNNKNFTLITNIHILSESNDSIECLKYKNINCKTYNSTKLYSNQNLGEKYNSITLNDPVKEIFPNLDQNKYQTYFYSMNDWATFLSNVSINTFDKIREKQITKLDIYILFSDVLNLGSTNDIFFTTSPLDERNIESCDSYWDNCVFIGSLDWQKCVIDKCVPIYYSSGNNEYLRCVRIDCDPIYKSYVDNICNPNYKHCVSQKNNISFGNYFYKFYCIKNDNFSLSNIPVEKAKLIIQKNNHIVYPILIENNPIVETETERNYMIAYDNYNDLIEFSSTQERDGGNRSTIFGKVGCEGTFENSTDSIFHKETRLEHKNQLLNISSISNGQLIEYTDADNFYDTIVNIINNTLSNYILEIGSKKNTSHKSIINKILNVEYLLDNVRLDIYLEVYDNNYIFNSTLDFEPIINGYYNDSNNFYMDISYNKGLKNVYLENNKAIIEEISKIDNLLYKYKLTFSNYIPISINNLKLNYTDIYDVNKVILIN